MKPINTLYEQNQEMVLLLFQLTHIIATLLEVLTFSILLCTFGRGKSVNTEGPLCVSVCTLWQR